MDASMACASASADPPMLPVICASAVTLVFSESRNSCPATSAAPWTTDPTKS